ncbi:alpha/beta hydrolase [Spongiibacter marinus]|uniref:alpha/beta hydrolase n=1 Tax=Spongiibacter marinus TaxID=354246 RepID=UPI000403EB39|nr:alpha/beta fold hydrolase [Spongiibacter marinus]
MSLPRKDVEFLSQGTRCRAWHYPTATPQACIVMAHGLGGTRDAGLEPYAQRFADAGFAVLLFDYRHFGASDGEPRQLLSIPKQLQDWRAAISFAETLPNVDAKRIALWGSSFSGGHVISTAAADKRVAAVAAQGPMMDGLASVSAMLDYAGVGRLLKLSAYGVADLAKSALGGSPVMVPIIAKPGGFAAMSSHDAWSGYRAIQPKDWKNAMSARLALALGTYRPTMKAKNVHCPALIQVCLRDTVAPASAAIRLAKKLGKLATLKQYDIGHFDIYVKEPFERAVSDQITFYQEQLNAAK